MYINAATVLLKRYKWVEGGEVGENLDEPILDKLTQPSALHSTGEFAGI